MQTDYSNNSTSRPDWWSSCQINGSRFVVFLPSLLFIVRRLEACGKCLFMFSDEVFFHFSPPRCLSIQNIDYNKAWWSFLFFFCLSSRHFLFVIIIAVVLIFFFIHLKTFSDRTIVFDIHILILILIILYIILEDN